MDTVEIVLHPAEQPEAARKLLAAAEAAGLHPRVVRTGGDGFHVPAEVAEAAGLGAVAEEEGAPETPETPKASRRNPKAPDTPTVG